MRQFRYEAKKGEELVKGILSAEHMCAGIFCPPVTKIMIFRWSVNDFTILR